MKADPYASRWRHAFSVLTALSTLFLIFWGGLVTSTESGLSVPDWPLSYGVLLPPMQGGIFYEHGHRMIAATVGFLMVALAAWTWLAEPRRWVRWLAVAALGAVLVQGVLGGITVLWFLPHPVSIAHGILAQIFFCLTVTIAVATSPGWQRSQAASKGTRLARLAPLAAVVVFVQLVLGAVMRHLDAGLAIPDFPTMHGGLWPNLAVDGAAVHLAHRLWALPVLVVVPWAAIAALKSRDGRGAGVRAVAWLTLVLVAAQATLGAITVLTQRAVTPTTLHVATGAAVLGLTVVLALWSRRALPAADPLADAELAAGRDVASTTGNAGRAAGLAHAGASA